MERRDATDDGAGLEPVDARRDLSRRLRPAVFPADRAALLHEAISRDAPAPTVELLARLPDGTTHATVHEVCAALGHPPAAESESRDAAAHDPLGGGVGGGRPDA